MLQLVAPYLAKLPIHKRGGHYLLGTKCLAGGLGGRLDHTLSNLNLLHKLPNIRMVLCGDGNLAELIRPGTTIVEVDKSIHGPACGLVALKAPAKVTTKGLTWNCGMLLLPSPPAHTALPSVLYIFPHLAGYCHVLAQANTMG